MQEHQQRVVAEKMELDEKREKFSAFVGGDIWQKLDPAEKARMRRQMIAMQDYSTALKERIEAFD